MSEEKIFEAAKNGNSQAIAAMINKNLGTRGISVKASCNNVDLIVIAESETAPQQDFIVDFLRSGITKLEPANVSRVIVRGRAAGQTTNEWQEAFNLPSFNAAKKFNEMNASNSDDVTVTSSHSSTPKSSYSSPEKVLGVAGPLPASLSFDKSVDAIRPQNSNSIQIFGWVLFTIGALMLLSGLNYDATVASESSYTERTYNIGKISNKSTYTNTGGFLAVCGAIFVTHSKSQKENKKS